MQLNIKLFIIACVLIACVLLVGIYFVMRPNNQEGLQGILNNRCPNILIQEGSRFYLFNANKAKIPGVNPIQFDNLNEYVEFIHWQRSQGIRCPVLYLQHSYDAQNKSVYMARADPVEDKTTKLLDASRDDPPYNTNSFPAFDANNQDIGLETPLDKMFNESSDEKSPNAMHPNWGGEDFSQDFVNAIRQ